MPSAQQPGCGYFWMDLGLWGIALGALIWAWPRLPVRVRWLAGLTAVWVMLLQVINELLSLRVFHAWTFSLEHNRFIGIQWLGAPLEEYLFWFAFSWMIPFIYSGLRQIFISGQPPRLACRPPQPRTDTGQPLRTAECPPRPAADAPGAKKLYLIWWLLGTAAVVAAGLPLLAKRINWRSLLLTSAFFVALMTAAESLGLYWQWWIWNPDQLLGPRVGLIPLEEFMLYFLVVPLLAVFQTGFEWLDDKISKG